ncbi:MAG: magnesium transporter [Alphaproteobacteria bacterium]
MSDSEPRSNRETGDKAPETELYGITPELVAEISTALQAGEISRVDERVAALHSADVADLVEALASEDRRLLVEAVRHHLDPEILAELDEHVRPEIIDQLGAADVAAAIGELDTDDAVEVVETLDDEAQQRVLEAVSPEDRVILEEGLTYPEDSAGRLMQRELVAVPSYWNVGQTIDFMRDAAEADSEELPDDFYDISVVDPAHRLLGTVPLSRVLRNKRPVQIEALMEPDKRIVPVTMDQEDVALLFRQYGLVSAPVVDASDRLVGVITVDDVVDVIDEEAEEDIMHLGGVSEIDIYSAAIETTRSRFSWLAINLLTAILASIVISFFTATIEKIVALAVLMPIVASMGGNAGTQAMTVAVRSLAMKDLTPANALRVVGKEVLVGSFNGILFAIIMGVVAWLWFSDPAIGLVIAAAMIINLFVAGLAGVAIPLMLERNGVDPAVASGVLLTTITDVLGFLAFLGLAAIFLL